MDRVVRAMLVLMGAFGFLFALAWAAQADVVDPASAFQPASTSLFEEGQPMSGESLVPVSPFEQSFFSVVRAPVADEAVATPAPEQQIVSASAAQFRRAGPSAASAGSILDRALHGAQMGFRDVGAFLGRAASACQVGLATSAGGPVLVLAVLSMAAPFARRRAQWARGAADEDVPEFLYAWDVISPG